MNSPATHRPVLLEDVVALLSPIEARVLVDCTIGAGGHAEALLKAAPQAQLIGIDRDETNLRLARQHLEPFASRIRLFHANFADLPEVLSEADVPAADAVLADLGAASMQLDDPERGFSFAADGPLDMRMDTHADRTAEELVNTLGEKQLADLIYANAQERYSRRIARAIVAARKAGRIERTGELAQIVARAYPAVANRTRRGVHPATRTFQALRMAVNDELTSLDRLLDLLPDALALGGRAAVISFHSLEDRRVKNAFKRLAATGVVQVLTKKPMTPNATERMENPRCRSAKLRGIERIG